jgi:hypothetical protein
MVVVMTFEDWLKQLAIELSKAFDLEGGVVDGAQYIKDTGVECWCEMFDDGLTPAEAANEEVLVAMESQ